MHRGHVTLLTLWHSGAGFERQGRLMSRQFEVYNSKEIPCTRLFINRLVHSFVNGELLFGYDEHHNVRLNIFHSLSCPSSGCRTRNDRFDRCVIFFNI